MLKPENVSGVTSVSGDASGRQYFRLHLKNSRETIILVKLVSGTGPKHKGPVIDQNLAFMLAEKVLREHTIPAGGIIYDGRRKNFYLLEDLGDLRLSELLQDANVSMDKKTSYLSAALRLTSKIQRIPRKASPLLKREMDYKACYFETSRFSEIYLAKHRISPEDLSLIDRNIKLIVTETVKQKQTAIHRDYMPWNLMIDNYGDLKIIDYQDMCSGSYVYDLISVIHDRDIDAIFSDAEIFELIKYFAKIISAGEEIYRDYLYCLLQRNLRLTGHFLFLTEKTGKSIYKDWVPGCLKRSARAIASLPELSELAEKLKAIIPGFSDLLIKYEWSEQVKSLKG